MTQQILIEEKTNYGRVSYYPVNKIAKTICNTYQKKHNIIINNVSIILIYS